MDRKRTCNNYFSKERELFADYFNVEMSGETAFTSSA